METSKHSSVEELKNAVEYWRDRYMKQVKEFKEREGILRKQLTEALSSLHFYADKTNFYEDPLRGEVLLDHGETATSSLNEIRRINHGL